MNTLNGDLVIPRSAFQVKSALMSLDSKSFFMRWERVVSAFMGMDKYSVYTTDSIIIGDDPIANLSAAFFLSRIGSVLIIPTQCYTGNNHIENIKPSKSSLYRLFSDLDGIGADWMNYDYAMFVNMLGLLISKHTSLSGEHSKILISGHKNLQSGNPLGNPFLYFPVKNEYEPLLRSDAYSHFTKLQLTTDRAVAFFVSRRVIKMSQVSRDQDFYGGNDYLHDLSPSALSNGAISASELKELQLNYIEKRWGKNNANR